MVCEMRHRRHGDRRVSGRPDQWAGWSSWVVHGVRGIVAFEMPIGRLEGKFKLNQKSSAADRDGAIEGLRGTGDPESLEVARLMAEFNPPA